MATSTRYVVRCADWTTGDYATREQAQRRLESIEAEGHCAQAHEVVELEA